MQKTVVLKEVQMLPFALNRIVNRACDPRLIREARTTNKTDLQVKFFASGFTKRNVVHLPG